MQFETSKKQKLWTKLQKSTQHPNKEELILGDYFFKQGKIIKSKRYFELYNNSIYYYYTDDLK